MKDKKGNRATMQVGDRILINKGISQTVYFLARVEIPHSTEKVFATKSGGNFTIGIKVWKSDYVWSYKHKMWVPKNQRS